ncbi:MAG: SGNH/GDSL hydrolase family protein, partial [Methanothrix sp.]|nr:SGNH/GDSL hydrolase family protein [Methanothrix sp.]
MSVPLPGQYEVQPGAGESAFNVTTLEGKEVYRRDVGQPAATRTSVQLEPKKRYALKTIFFKKPGHDFRVPLTDRPGALETVLAAKKERWGFLKDADGGWGKRDDVVVYDGQPIYNNTKAIGRLLQVPADPKDPRHGVGPDLMFGRILGEQVTEPVLIIRFATRHPVWFLRGSRSLGHDYLPPSSGGDPDLKGAWDVIHFNWGVWDAMYREAGSKFYKGRHTTSASDYENNLRKLVARLKQTGATLIWASVTPVWKGEPDKPNGDVVAFNEVAAKVMKENGVMIDDLNSLVPKGEGSWVSHNVHDVGHLAPHVTKTILAAIASRPHNTQPLPRVLLIGDSITGGYEKQVMKDLDGKAAVYKNPGNAEDTWNGVAKIDEWLDLKRYLQNGQEYLEWINGVNDA